MMPHAAQQDESRVQQSAGRVAQGWWYGYLASTYTTLCLDTSNSDGWLLMVGYGYLLVGIEARIPSCLAEVTVVGRVSGRSDSLCGVDVYNAVPGHL
jgi:hypothetical protein